MGVVFFIGFLMVVLVGGLLCLGLGIGGMIASVITRKKGKRENGKKIAIPSAILLILGTAVLLLPVGYLGFIYAVNTLPPDDYVKTDILIEEDGYQSERFTADGVVYTVLPLASGQIEKKESSLFLRDLRLYERLAKRKLLCGRKWRRLSAGA